MMAERVRCGASRPLQHATSIAALALWIVPQVCTAAVVVQGRVFDINGEPVTQAMVTLNRPGGGNGADATTVFTDTAGRFLFPRPINAKDVDGITAQVKALAYRQVSPALGPVSVAEHGVRSQDGVVKLLFVLQSKANQAEDAPASAWLQTVPNSHGKATLVIHCVGCHQFPTREVRDFAQSLNAVSGANPDEVRDLSWRAIVKYMRFQFARVLSRGFGSMPPYEMATDPNRITPDSDDEEVVVDLLRKHLPRHLNVLEGYDYGAPLAVNSRTVIREYTVPGVNAIREALTLGALPQVWVADFFGDKLVRIDVETGVQHDYAVPFDGATGPHTLVRGKDGSLWVSMTFNSLLGRLDPATGEWRLWRLGGPDAPGEGIPPSIHDMSYDASHELALDTRGRVWNTDIANNALVSFDPATGASERYLVPLVPGRTARQARLYGIAMTADRQHVWYTQLGGYFGCFNTETLEYETVVEVPPAAGPRRPALTEEDILYVPLFGAGQLIEYDAGARKQLAVYDLPDRASAPYAVTWDAKRRVVWVATSNADVIYRFDAAGKTFGVIPLPRQKAFLRMLAVDPRTGLLVTSYANLPDNVDGPRMALVIDPGDGVH